MVPTAASLGRDFGAERRFGSRTKSNGIPTARYPDVVLSDDPAAVALLAQEITRVKRARGALARGDGAGAMNEVEGYRTMPSNHVLETEVMAIGVEALLLQKKQSEAASLAKQLLARLPEGPLADRVGEIASGPVK